MKEVYMTTEPQNAPDPGDAVEEHSPNPANNPPATQETEVDVQVHEPVTTGLETPDPQPAEGTETEPAPVGPVDPEPAEGAQQTPNPGGPPRDSEGNPE